jgi:hypothetical protein
MKMIKEYCDEITGLGDKAWNHTQTVFTNLLNIGVNNIQNACNTRRERLLVDWGLRIQHDHNAKMVEYELPDATYRGIGIPQTQPPFDLFEPESVSVIIWSNRVYPGHENSPMLTGVQPNPDTWKNPKLFIILRYFEEVDGQIKCKTLRESFEDQLIHEFLHCCGDADWRNPQIHDGIVRHNIVGVQAIKEAINPLYSFH